MDRQQKYQDGLKEKGLKNLRVVVPARSEKTLREWAKEERQEWAEEQMVNDIPCIDNPADDPANKE